MANKIITVKNIRGYKIDIFCEKTPYTVQDLIFELSKHLGDDVKYTEYKILLDGDVLDDNYDLSSNSAENIIYLRRAKKNNTENMDNIAKHVLGLYLETLLKDTQSLKVLVSCLPQDIFTADCTQSQVCEPNNVDQLNDIIKTYVDHFNLPYNYVKECPKVAIYNQDNVVQVLDDMKTMVHDIDVESKFSTDNRGKNWKFSAKEEDEEDDNEEEDNEEEDNEKEDNEEEEVINNEHCVFNEQCRCVFCNNIEKNDGEEDEYMEDKRDNENEDGEGENNNIIPLNGHVSEEIMEQFTDEERNDIDEIVRIGYSLFDAAQMYVACGKNLDQTLELLSTI